MEINAFKNVDIPSSLKFDFYLLKDYAKFMGVDWKFMVNKFIDTNALARGLKMGIKYNPKNSSLIEYQYRMANIYAKGIKTRIPVLAQEYGIPCDENRLHDAVYDLEINLAIWNRLKQQIEI